MKEDQHYIDKIFNEALTDYKELPDDSAWEGIAVGITAPAASASKAVLMKKIFGLLLMSGYLLVGPLFYSDLLFERAQNPGNQAEQSLTKELTTSGTTNESPVSLEPALVSKEKKDYASEASFVASASPKTKDTSSQMIAQESEQPGAGKEIIGQAINKNSKVTNVDLSGQKSGQEELMRRPVRAMLKLHEVEDVVAGLHALDYAYSTFLFPVLNESVPIDSVSGYQYYEDAWKWYVSPYAMPVYWAGTGLGRVQLGFDVGRYFNGRSSLQLGLRYQHSSGNPRMGDSGVLTIPLQYRRYFGRSQFKWFLGAGGVFIPEASPGRPFEGGAFSSNYFDLEFSGGMIYRPSDKMRFYVSPTWLQPLSGEHGVSVRLGVQFRF